MSPHKPRVAYLVYDLLTPGVVYHAAFVSGEVRPYTPPHTHDFYEVFYVVEGSATHVINDRTVKLRPGDLVMIRPDDCHSIAGKMFHLINIAFPVEPWERFCALAGLDQTGLVRASAADGPAASVPSASRDACAAVFVRALHAFQQPSHGRAARQELCWFWSAMLEHLLPGDRESVDPNDRRPAWLVRACRAMHEAENLRVGLPRFVAVSGVSRSHLTRILKGCCGQTPTEFINDLRLRRAALLLSTTPMEIIDIAMDCGYDNLSYFYRRFRRQYGKSPRVWRLESQNILMPLHA